MITFKNIFFDWDSTLWDFSSNSEKSLGILFKEYRFDRYFPDFETFHSIYKGKNEELWEAYALGKIKREFLETERFEYPFRHIGVRDEECVNALKTRYLDLLGEQTKLIDGAEALVRELHSKGVRLYIISNGFSRVQHKKIGNSGLEGYFSRVFLSEDVKAHKPSKEFFDYAIKSSNSRKRESLVVGDNFTADIAGAHNAGIAQVWFAPHYNGEPLPFQPTHIISSLSDVLSVIITINC